MSLCSFILFSLICVALQVILFIPFIFIWKKDCKKIGKDRLAVSLKERFAAWLLVFPIWIQPIVCILREVVEWQ